MIRGSSVSRILLVALLLACAGMVRSQEDLPVTLVTPDGSHVPFTIFVHAGVLQITTYAGDVGSPAPGLIMMDVGGTMTPVPVDRVARTDLVSWGGEEVWRHTLTDGRVFIAPRGSGSTYYLTIVGTNEFGVEQRLTSRPGQPSSMPFRGIVFDPNALSDTVYLRVGDVLNGTIAPRPLSLSTAYGVLVFEPWQLQRIVVEGTASGEDVVLLRSGDRMRGRLGRDPLELIVAGGTTVIPLAEIESVTFMAR